MEKTIIRLLDTTYSGHLYVRYEKIFNTTYGSVIHGNDVILTGQVTIGDKFSYTTWKSTYNTFSRIYNYIPIEINIIETSLVSWVKTKFKLQGTSLDNELNRFI